MFAFSRLLCQSQSMKYFLALGCLMLTQNGSFAKSQSNERTIQVYVGTLLGANQPYEALVSALLRDKKSQLFRISWDSNASNSRNGMTALYNRRRRTLKYYSVDHSLIDDEIGKYRHTREHTLYRGVIDSILQRLAFKNRKATQSDNSSFFAQLPQFGCQKRRLRYSVTYTLSTQR